MFEKRILEYTCMPFDDDLSRLPYSGNRYDLVQPWLWYMQLRDLLRLYQSGCQEILRALSTLCFDALLHKAILESAIAMVWSKSSMWGIGGPEVLVSWYYHPSPSHSIILPSGVARFPSPGPRCRAFLDFFSVYVRGITSEKR